MSERVLTLNHREEVWYLDWLRVLGCVAVVIIHCFTTLLDNEPIAEVGVGRSLIWTEILVIGCRWAVPVFLMITGSLLLDPAREMGLAKIHRYVARMVGVLLTFGALYALIELVFNTRSFNLTMVLEAPINVLQGKCWAHMWYLYDLVGIYLLLPILRSFAEGVDENTYDAVLWTLFALVLVVPTINAAMGLSIETLVWLGSSVFYVLLGWRVRMHQPPFAPTVFLGAAGAMSAAIMAGGGIVMGDSYLGWVWAPSSPLIALQAVAVFVLAQRFLDTPMRKGGPAMLVASLSFGIYVLHPVFANLVYKVLGWNPALLPPVIFELLTFAIVFGGALALALLCKRLPIVGRWL